MKISGSADGKEVKCWRKVKEICTFHFRVNCSASVANLRASNIRVNVSTAEGLFCSLTMSCFSPFYREAARLNTNSALRRCDTRNIRWSLPVKRTGSVTVVEPVRCEDMLH